jgi:leucine dehydrogenase
VAIEVSCAQEFGSASLKGRTVAVVGLGNVGGRLAARLARAGAKLVVADVNPARRALAEQFGARWTSPQRALTAAVDVVAPCALGGILDDETVPALRAPVVAGAANNQLADDRIADLLHDRGILWAPDFVANAGGIVNISVELEPGGYDPRRARAKVRRIGDTLEEVYGNARAIGATPLTAAMELARRRLSRPQAPQPRARVRRAPRSR